MADEIDDDGFPPDVAMKLLHLDRATREMAKHFKDNAHIRRLKKLNTGDALQKAKVNLVYLFAVQSSFWVYLTLRGEDPKTHPIRGDMGKIQALMARVRDIEGRRKMARLDLPATNRFIKSGLKWSNKRKSDGAGEAPAKKSRKS